MLQDTDIKKLQLNIIIKACPIKEIYREAIAENSSVVKCYIDTPKLYAL